MDFQEQRDESGRSSTTAARFRIRHRPRRERLRYFSIRRGGFPCPAQSCPARLAISSRAAAVHAASLSAAEGSAMHDIVIRGGTIVDGTGAPRFYRRRRHRRRADRRGRRQGRAGAACHRCRRPVGHAGLGRRPYPLRRPGDLGPDPRAVLMAWCDDDPVRQLRRRLRAGTAASTATALIDLMEGVEDIPGPVLAEGLTWEWESFPDYLDALDRMPRDDRCRRPGPASSAARLCDGRARDPSRAGNGRRHRADARADRRGGARRRLRLYDLAHQCAQDDAGRNGARPFCRNRRTDRYRRRARARSAPVLLA